MRGSREGLGVQFLLLIFVVDKGIEYPNTALNGPLAGR